MASKREAVEEQLDEVWQDLRDLWVALTVDPKKQARKERIWSMLSGALGAAAGMGARRATTKLWDVLTGEPPPPVQKALEEAAQHDATTHAEPMQGETTRMDTTQVETMPGRADA